MQQLLDRTKAPAMQVIPSIPILDIDKSKLSNGVDFFSLAQPSFKTISFEVCIPKDYSRSRNYALGYLATRMLQEGTNNLDSEQIAEQIAANGAFFEVNYSNDYISLQLYCLQPFFEDLLHLVYHILYSPSFPDKEFENLKSRYIQQFQTNIEKTSYLASVHSKQLFFGQDHAYTTNTSVQDIETIQLEDIKDYYQQVILAAKPTVYLTGEFGHKEIDCVEEIFGKGVINESYNHALERQTQKSVGERFIHKENAVQNTLAIVGSSVLKTHEDYHKLMITNEILGGFFGSRLMKNIREDKGFTYGIYSKVVSLKHDAYFYIGADLKPSFVSPCIDEIKKEINVLREEKVLAAELEILKNYLLGRFSASLNSVYDHMKKRKAIQNLRLKDSFYDEYLNTVKQISTTDIMEMAQKYLNFDQFLVLNVGVQ